MWLFGGIDPFRFKLFKVLEYRHFYDKLVEKLKAEHGQT